MNTPEPFLAGNRLSLAEALVARRSTRDFGTKRVDAHRVAALAQVVTRATDAQGHRAAPSAHGLYPIRLYVTAADVVDLADGVWRATGEMSDWRCVRAGDCRKALGEAASIFTLCGNMTA